MSKKGAQGFAQVLPQVAASPGYGIKPLADVTNRQDSVRFVREYLTAMSKKYSGNMKYALMAYNWGPGNVDKWLNSGADISKVPSETLNYLNKLLPYAK